jgi:hypothetical protein
MSFAWLFSIIAGAVIILIAIYAAITFSSSSRQVIDAKILKDLSIVIDPLQTSFQDIEASKISFMAETRFYNKCELDGKFGEQRLSLSSSSRIGEKWQEPEWEAAIANKYIFSQDLEQGKKVIIFNMPFEMPFKVSDLVFITAGKYCFIKPPRSIERNIEIIDEEFFQIDNCSEDAIKVCFDESCDIEVRGECANCRDLYEQGTVYKNGKQLAYSGNLLYGAIISSKELYECNIKRLMARTASLADVYLDTARIMGQRDCESNMETELMALKSSAEALDGSFGLANVLNDANKLRLKNYNTLCSLFPKSLT